MRVVIINRSDSAGGAAVVSRRLMHALRQSGVDARMLVIDRNCTDDEWVASYASPVADKAAFLAERLDIFMHNGFSREDLFKVDTARWGRDLSQHEWVKDADVIMLNWINQGALSLNAIDRICSLGKPVIWTMHDMWNCTGICHHAYECRSFTGKCGKCQYLKSHHSRDLARRTQQKKASLYAAHSNLTFVAVSNWLGFRCRESSLMESAAMEVIPNAFPIDSFSFARQSGGDIMDARGKKVVVMGAARLDDPVKGFDYALKTFRHIAEHKPRLADRLHIVLYGAIRNHALIDEIALPHTFVGKVSGIAGLNNIYTQADIVLSTSLYETLPGTLIEGQACGCLPVTFGNGGQADIVDHKQTGYIARYCNPEDIAGGIEWAVDADVSREMLHCEVERKFSAQNIANRYIDLCNMLLEKCGRKS